MTALLTLVRKDLLLFVRNTAALLLTFIVPIALIFIFGQIFGLGGSGDGGPGGIRLAVVNESSLPPAQQLVEALQKEPAFTVVLDQVEPNGARRPLTEADARASIVDGAYRFAVIIPADVISAERLGVRLKLLSDPRNQIESEMTNGLLQKTLFTQVPQLLGRSLQLHTEELLGPERFASFNRDVAQAVATAFALDPTAVENSLRAGDFGMTAGATASATGATTKPTGSVDTAGAANANFLAQIFALENEQVVGRDVKNPEATRIVGGYAVMFLLFAISGSSTAFFEEKNSGLFQRILSSPVTRGQLLTSRFLFGILLGIVQLVTLFVAGSLMFGVEIWPHIFPLLVVSVAAAAACASFGMFVAAVAPNAQAASSLATFIILLMSAVGGAWFPLSIMPPFMQMIGKFTIVYWSVEGFQQVLWAGRSLLQVLPTVGVLVAITAGVMAFSIWRLNRRELFG